MSGRHDDYKGSSRSTRDDSRQYKDVRKVYKEYERRRSRSRSRSPRRRPPPPRRRPPPPRSSKQSPPRSSASHSHEKDEKKFEEKKQQATIDSKTPTEWDSSEEDVPAPPPPPRITPISIDFTKPKGPIKMNLSGPEKGKDKKKPMVASVFNDDDDEPEEMPAEARMRMRNIGRETPTSAGPNSFGKTKQGFCDAKKVFEKNLKHALDTVEKPILPKYAQTIYKIKGP